MYQPKLPRLKQTGGVQVIYLLFLELLMDYRATPPKRLGGVLSLYFFIAPRFQNALWSSVSCLPVDVWCEGINTGGYAIIFLLPCLGCSDELFSSRRTNKIHSNHKYQGAYHTTRAESRRMNDIGRF
jgi:hypothetical protein